MYTLNPASRQRGVVLMITLIVLVIMALAGISLTRSVDTANSIAGNLAFQQSASQSADAGLERAVEWLEANGVNAVLRDDAPLLGYSAGSDNRDPAPGQTWDSFWTNVLANQAMTLNYVSENVVAPVPYGSQANPDGAGNTVSYAIQRMCDATTLNQMQHNRACSQPPSTARTGTSKNGSVPLNFNDQGYYRVTVRVAGPRNTVVYAQALVAM